MPSFFYVYEVKNILEQLQKGEKSKDSKLKYA